MNEPDASPRPSNETNRQIEHIVPIAFALFLRWLPPWGAVGMVSIGVVYAIFISPRLVPSGLRPEERALRCIPAKLHYALAVLLLVIAFRRRLHLAAGAWAMLSVGDGCASLAGVRWGGKRLPWNRRKTWIGLATFLLTGWVSSAVLLAWVSGRYTDQALSIRHALLPALIAAFFAAVIESLPISRWIDDNLSVPLAGGLILAFLI
ncbi:MAG: hypothetical protein GXP25_05035 [Planctomycetes bacterium]|nr:hypothetical protein [Planctomycetota bacterium]